MIRNHDPWQHQEGLYSGSRRMPGTWWSHCCFVAVAPRSPRAPRARLKCRPGTLGEGKVRVLRSALLSGNWVPSLGLTFLVWGIRKGGGGGKDELCDAWQVCVESGPDASWPAAPHPFTSQVKHWQMFCLKLMESSLLKKFENMDTCTLTSPFSTKGCWFSLAVSL